MHDINTVRPDNNAIPPPRGYELQDTRNSIRHIQNLIRDLNGLYDELRPRVSQLEAALSDNVFLSIPLNSLFIDELAKIAALQKEILERYQQLGLGTLPEHIASAADILEKQEKLMAQKAVYMDSIRFFMTLSAKDPATQACLDQHKEPLAQYDFSQSSAEECEKVLGKYVLLKKALEETDPKAKFALLMQMNNLFELQIIYDINIDGISQAVPDSPAMVSSSSPDSQAHAYPVSAPDSELSLSCDSAGQSSKDPVSGPQFPDISRGTEPAADSCSDSEAEEVSWEALGIDAVDEVTVHIDDSKLTCQEPGKTKKFGAKDFKNDMIKVGSISSRLALVSSKRYGGVTPELLSSILGREKFIHSSVCEKLTQLGYLNKYTLLGYGQFFTLSSKGLKAFRTKDSASYLGYRQQTDDILPLLVESTANSTLARIMMFHSFALARSLDPDYNYVKYSAHLNADGYILILPRIFPKKSNLGFICLISDNPKEFDSLKTAVLDLLEKMDIIAVTGMNQRHAKALASWLYTCLSHELSGKRLCYLDYETEIFYNYDDDSIVSFEESPDHPDSQEESEVKAASVSSGAEAPETVPSAPSPEITDQTTPTAAAEHALEAETPKAESPNPAGPRSAANSPAPLSAHPKAHFQEMVYKMLSDGRHYCAAAYLRSLSEKDPEYILPYTQLAYALNDPLAQCVYSSPRVFQIYYGKSGTDNDYYLLSAVLRNYFLDHSSYDYSLQQLQGSIASVSLLEDNQSLSQVLYTLQTFKSDHHRGMDFYADYRQKKREAFEKNLTAVRMEARELYDSNAGGIIKENASHRRVLETKKLIFAKDSDLVVCLEAVKDDNREYLDIIRDFLSTSYIKDGEAIRADNIDPAKIDQVLDTNWELAATNMRLVKRTSDLMSSLRMNLFKLVKKVVVVLCGYVSALEENSVDENDPGFIDYRRARNTLLKNISAAVSSLKNSGPDTSKAQAGRSVLQATLTELASRLDGSYEEDSSLYFYLGFLKNDKVLLDDDYLPVLDDVNEIPELSVLSRIEDHFTSPEKSLEDRLVEIFNGGDDYGCAALILRYLKKYSAGVKNKELLNSSIENAVLYPRKDLENKRKEFIEDLELAQSYGQIDNTAEDRKEALIQIMDSWYTWAMDTDNYGFFYKILAAIRQKIKEDAQVRGVELMAGLTAYEKENPHWRDQKTIQDAVTQIQARIHSQNYAAAEDLLNRLAANDLESDTNFIQQDYLEEFLREYPLNSSQAGTARSTLQSRLLKGQHNKDTKGAGRLIENWPKGNGAPPSRIRDLLLTLGFAVEEVTPHAPIQGKDHYQVTLKRPANGRKSNYKHPISVFGSEAEEKGFRVVNIFGKMDAGRLIDTFKEIGTAKNTLILLDHTLTLPDRRELARKTKTEFASKTFLVVDRVVLVYLANHYSETAVNRMLMAVTIPFSACQPYVSDSAKLMPPEIFMGRKHELEKIESASGVNIVYGGRQLGKSALLRMAQKDINMNENRDRAILVDLKGLDYRAAARRISGALYDEGILKTEHITEDWDQLSRDIKNRLRDTSGPDHIPYLLLLMDEADVFIESCEAVDYMPFDALKDIQGVGPGRFKFVVAGLRDIVRFKKNIALSNNSVLTHLSSLTVTPFKSTEARELLEVPLSYLGFRFPDDSKTQMLISTIFGTTNYFPGLLQLYCAKLVEAMGRDYAGYSETETPPYIVREEHIKKALSDKTLEEQIREKFFITLKYGDDDYYYLIALLTAFHYHNSKGQNGCGAQDILTTASGYGISRISSLTREKVAALMEEMRELNVLQHAGHGRYRFARHNFCQMMGSVQDIDDEILDYAIRQED